MLSDGDERTHSRINNYRPINLSIKFHNIIDDKAFGGVSVRGESSQCRRVIIASLDQFSFPRLREISRLAIGLILQ